MNTKIITLDINKKIFEPIIAKQGDTASRFLLFNLFDNGVAFNLTGRSVRAYAIKPDGTKIYNDLVINDAAKGICTLELTTQMLAVEGFVNMELVITEGTKKLSSIPFILRVIGSLNGDSAVVSTNEFTVLQKALASIQNIDNRFEEVNSSLETKTNKGNISVYDINKNYGKLDQTYLTDELLQQIAGNTPINVVPADNSITKNKLTFTPVEGYVGKNLYNKTMSIDGKNYDITNGNLVTDSGNYFTASEFIKVVGNTTYYCNIKSYIHFYDNAKKWISYFGYGSTFLTPTNCAYVTLSFDRTKKELQQLEKGSVATSYENYNVFIEGNILKDNSVPITKLVNGGITINDITFSSVGKNKFNKATAILDKYIDISNGVTIVTPSGGLSYSDYIVVENTQYYINDRSYIIYYDNDKKFISATSLVNTFSPPANCKFIRVDFKTTMLNTLQIEKGQQGSVYEEWKMQIDSNYIPTSSTTNQYGIYIVSKDGNGNFTSIGEAVNNVLDGSTILIMPGVYEEVVRCGNKSVSLIGVDKTKCILLDKTGKYDNSPLYISMGYVKNMTIKALYDSNLDYSSVTTTSYAVHIDNYGENGNLLIENCYIHSDFSNALGCGAKNNHSLKVKNCDIVTTNASALYPNASGFAYHGSALNTKSTVILDNNRFFSNGLRDILFQTDGTINDISVFAYYNNAKLVTIPSLNTIYKVIDGYGNRATILNN